MKTIQTTVLTEKGTLEYGHIILVATREDMEEIQSILALMAKSQEFANETVNALSDYADAINSRIELLQTQVASLSKQIEKK